MTTPNIKAQKSSYFQGRKMWFWVAGGLGVITLTLLVIFLQSLISTTTYYVLNRDVPARTQITPDMLEERKVSEGGQPPTALGLENFAESEVYTKFSLTAGDILSSSNAGSLIPLGAGLPKNFSIASFTASPNNAAGGNVTRGDYVDIYYIEPEQGGSKLIFQRVLIVDATSDISSGGDETVATTEDTATAPYRVGIPTLYTVGLSQEDVAKLALASQGTLYVTISSADAVEKGVGDTTLGFSIGDMLADAVGDSGAGTDNTFDPNRETTSGTDTNGSGTTPAPSNSPAPNNSVPPTEPDANSDNDSAENG